MTDPTKRDDSEEVKRGLWAVDGILPDNVNRRHFLETAVTGTVLGFAGCLGGGGSSGGSTTTAGSEPTTTAGSEPTTTAGSEPTTTAGSEPTTTAGSEPTTTAGSEPTTTAGSEPTTTAGSEPTTTAGSEPTTTAGSEPTTTAGNESMTTAGGKSSPLGSKMPFRLPVDPGPNYVTAYVAQQNGEWEDAGIVPLTPQGGNGSADTAKRVGTNVNHVGHSAVAPQVAGLAQNNFNILQFGTAKARTQSGLIHRTDAIDDPYDPESISGAKIAAASGLDAQMWQLFLQGIGADQMDISYIDTSSASSLLQKGSIDAIWDSINDYAQLQAQMDAELGFGAMYNVHPLAGYYLIVNSDWYQKNGMKEWTTRLMEGYSAAGHWTLTNPKAAMDLLVEQVPELKTVGRERLLRALAAGVAATNLTEGVQKNGFGYLDPEIHQNSFDTISKGIDVETPNADEALLTEVTDEVELTTFSNSEWSDLQSFAEPYGSLFQGTKQTTTSQ